MSDPRTPSLAFPAPAPAGPAGGLTALAFAAGKGDSVATTQLVRAVAPRVVRVVRLVLGGGHPDVDDAVQQSLIAFVQALPAFRGECEPAGYASKIAVRTAVAQRRRVRTLRAREDDAAETEGMQAPACESPGEQASSHRRKELLRELLAELPEEQSEALALRVVLGWSLEEIAASSGAPLNTVRSRLRLAKEALKRRIEESPALASELEVAG